MNKDVIVIGSDHYNTLWLIRSLGMGGFDVTAVIIESGSKSFVSKSRYCSSVYLVKDFKQMYDCLFNLSFSGKVPIFTNSDSIAITLDAAYDALSTNYILQHCNHKQGALNYWMDKANMLAMAKESGLVIPYSQAVDLTKEDVDYDIIPYPCLVKPEVSAESSKNAFRVCQDIGQLRYALSELKKSCPKVLIQEYIQRDYEYLVYGASTEDEVILPGGLTKVHTCSDTKNLGMASYAYLSDEKPAQLGNFERIHKFIRNIGYYGLFSVEFMITKDKAYFLEVNLRNDGTCYFTTQAGVNLPALWAASALGLNISSLSKRLNRPRTYGMNEANYLKYTLLSQPFFTSFKEVSKARVFSLCKWNDMVPVLAKITYGVRNVISQKLKNRVMLKDANRGG